jgi:glyoxylase-like metal-dependent hydrolase (beta-lactamase superfamily II)
MVAAVAVVGRLRRKRVGMTGASAAELPVAQQWFRFSNLDERTTLIEEPHAHELLSANAWHLRGRDSDLLIDCGLGITALTPMLRERFDRVPVLVLTHAHLDHMGSAHEFTEVWAHPLERVGNPAAGSLHGPVLAAELGLNEPLPPLLLTALPHAGFQPAAYRVQPATVTRALTDGDIVDLGDRTLTVLHLPGHSPGSIALFDRAGGTLFSGDVIYDGGLLDSLPGSDPEEYARSLRRLRDLPVHVTHAGHGPSFDRDRLHRLIDNYLHA